MMRRFHPGINSILAVRTRHAAGLVGMLCLLLCAGVATAQQPTRARMSPMLPSSISPDYVSRGYEIRQRFLTQQQESLEREFRAVQRCIDYARRSLRDVRGQINRTAQIDLQNCAARAVVLERKSKILERQGVRLSKQVQDEMFILQGLIKDFQTRRALSGGSSSSSE